ncbi:MAG: WYL domain-containing protein [Anaerovoracaceae bacterium]
MGTVEKLQLAAKRRVVAIITYTDSKGNATAREVEPYELRDDCFFAYCIANAGIRNFKINRIMTVTVTNKPYIPKWPINM